MSHVHRAGGIDADELYHDPPPTTHVDPTVVRPGRAYSLNLPLHPLWFQIEIDESRVRRLDAVYLLAGGHTLHQHFSQLQRVDARCTSQAQRQAGGKIPVLRFGRTFHQDLRRRFQVNNALLARSLNGLGDHLRYSVFNQRQNHRRRTSSS